MNANVWPATQCLLQLITIFCKQEIAWQRLEDLQPASDEVISRGVTGLKLYMVAPFLK